MIKKKIEDYKIGKQRGGKRDGLRSQKREPFHKLGLDILNIAGGSIGFPYCVMPRRAASCCVA